MTRLTNFGRKRKYLEAGFATELTTTCSGPHVSEISTPGDDQDSTRPKQKRKRTKNPAAHNDGEEDGWPAGNGEGSSTSGRKKAAMVKKLGDVAIGRYNLKKRTEQRRLMRISDRQASTVCFACREKGHAAKDCPNGGDGVNTTVGACYRCGSTKHTLSRCKKPEDPLNPLPFASCFVCSRKGHLASTCPQNKEKGIYPNGGSCKLCGEKTHLAKDCGLRKQDTGTAATTIFGTGGGAGADEDDFHAFKRKNVEITIDEKSEDRRRRQLDVRAGLHTGTVRVFGKDQVSSKSKKVVFF